MPEYQEQPRPQIHVSDLPGVPKGQEAIDAAFAVDKLPGADAIMAPPPRDLRTEAVKRPESEPRPSRLRRAANYLGRNITGYLDRAGTQLPPPSAMPHALGHPVEKPSVAGRVFDTMAEGPNAHRFQAPKPKL